MGSVISFFRGPKIIIATIFILAAIVLRFFVGGGDNRPSVSANGQGAPQQEEQMGGAENDFPELQVIESPTLETEVPEGAVEFGSAGGGRGESLDSEFDNPSAERGRQIYEAEAGISRIPRVPLSPRAQQDTGEEDEKAPPMPVRMVHGQFAPEEVLDEASPATEAKRQPSVGGSGQPSAPPLSEQILDMAYEGEVIYAPFGRLLRCRLVNTVESFDRKSPIIGLVTHDLVWNGTVVVPAGSEIHGTALSDTARGRILTDFTWRVILPRVEEKPVGTELRVRGIGLNRAVDVTGVHFGMSDATLGIEGFVIRTDSMDEIKLFLAVAMSAFASGLQETETNTITGGDQPSNTVRNANLDGVSAALNEYAMQIQEEIKRNGAYVQVPAGREFYVYIQHTIFQEASDLPLPPEIPANEESMLWEVEINRRVNEARQGAINGGDNLNPVFGGAAAAQSRQRQQVDRMREEIMGQMELIKQNRQERVNQNLRQIEAASERAAARAAAAKAYREAQGN